MSVNAGQEHAGAGRSRREQLRGLAALACGGSAGVLLAACGGPPAAGGTGGGPRPGELQGVTVEYWSSSAANPVGGQQLNPEEVARREVLDAFTKGNPYGARVDLVDAAPSADQTTLDKALTALAAGTPPGIVNMFNYNLSLLFARGGVVDVDAELKGNAEWQRARAQIYPNVVRGHSWKGKLFCVPSHNSLFMLYYQPDRLRQANLAAPPPKGWTWDQFLDYGRKASQPPDVTAYDGQWSFHRFGMTALNNGARFMSDDGTKFQFATPEVIEAAEYELTMAKSGLMRPHDGSATGGYMELIPQNRVVFQFAVANRVTTYRQQNIPFGTAYYPLGPRNSARASVTHGDAQGFAVFKQKDARKQQAALQAALWMTRPESGLQFTATSGAPPAYRNVTEAPEFKTRYQNDAAVWPFFDALPSFLTLPNFYTFSQAVPVINRQLLDIWAGKVGAREGLMEAQRQTQLLLDQALQ